MTHDIFVSIYQATRPGPTPHSPGECASFVGVSGLSSRPEGPNVYTLLCGTGWEIDKELDFRKLVKIELPEGVSYGTYKPYDAYDLKNHGFYGQYKSNDGSGRAVYVYCEPIKVDGYAENGIDAAMCEAIRRGITLSIPQQGGGRIEQNARVVAVSQLYEAYKDQLPSDWALELD